MIKGDTDRRECVREIDKKKDIAREKVEKERERRMRDKE